MLSAQLRFYLSRSRGAVDIENQQIGIETPEDKTKM